MEELIEVLEDILGELREINMKLNNNVYSMDDVYHKLEEMQGDGPWNTMEDICGKLDDIHLNTI